MTQVVQRIEDFRELKEGDRVLLVRSDSNTATMTMDKAMLSLLTLMNASACPFVTFLVQRSRPTGCTREQLLIELAFAAKSAAGDIESLIGASESALDQTEEQLRQFQLRLNDYFLGDVTTRVTR
jgi:hypothetical protein